MVELDGNEILINLEKRWKGFVKLYLSLEEWIHDENLIKEVDESQSVISMILKELKVVFPRSGGNGYKIPKFHGMMKMQYYIKLFGSGMNFYGGPGESHHKTFVKAPGKQTQRRVGEFAVQVAQRVYEDNLYSTALVSNADDTFSINEGTDVDGNKNDGGKEDAIVLSGGYDFNICSSEDYTITWNKEIMKKKKKETDIDPFMVRMIVHELTSNNINVPITLKGATQLSVTTDDGRSTFRAHPSFHGKQWYDWAYVSFLEEDELGEDEQRLYPSRILCFVEIPCNTIPYVVVQCSMKPISWEQLISKFIVRFNLGNELKSYAIVPVTSIVHPLAVFPDYGNNNRSTFFVVLPKRNWTEYFSSQLSKEKRKRNNSRKRKQRRG